MKKALVLLAGGAEEMEAVIAIDVLRRGGIKVTVAGLEDALPVKCSREVVIKPEISLDDALKSGPYDAVVLPGGLGGAENLSKSSKVKSVLIDQEKSHRIIAAICAGPTVLKQHKIAFGKQLTSYPSVKETMEEGNNYIYKEDRVVVDDNLVTSRGPGTAFEFALTLVSKMAGEKKAGDVRTQLLLQ